LHGANRLGGNSLSDILVFGRRAGVAAFEYAKGVEVTNIPQEDIQKEIARLLAPFSVTNGENPFELKDRIAATMWKYVGIVRNEEDLKKGLDEILRIKLDAKNVQAKGPRAFNQSWADSFALHNMLLDCEAIIRSALARKESRGAHTRSDYPKKDDANWFVNIVVKQKDGQMSLETRPVPKMPPEYVALIRIEETLLWKNGDV